LTIYIKNLTFKTIIGVLDFERVKKQRVIINLKATYDYRDNEFIDYVKLVKIIKKTMRQKKFKLLEDATSYITKKIIKKYPNIKKLKLEIIKPDILKDCQVSISKTFKVKK